MKFKIYHPLGSDHQPLFEIYWIIVICFLLDKVILLSFLSRSKKNYSQFIQCYPQRSLIEIMK